MPRFIDPKDVRPGDVLLMKGISAISDLIAWFGDSTYSHAALMVDGGAFVEAAPPVSRRVALSARLQQGAHYEFIDVYRPTQASGQPLQPVQRDALAKAGGALVGVGYPLDDMLQMGVFAGLRNRLPADAWLRWLLLQVLNELVTQNPKHMMCSELVYYGMREATLAPALIVSAQMDLPMPSIDVAQLIKEWLATRGKSVAAAVTAGTVTEVSDAQLQAMFEALQSQRTEAEPARALAAPALGMPPVLNANPKNVLPVDLETSPQLRRVGRLALTRA
jgi:hypothetical protein